MNRSNYRIKFSYSTSHDLLQKTLASRSHIVYIVYMNFPLSYFHHLNSLRQSLPVRFSKILFRSTYEQKLYDKLSVNAKQYDNAEIWEHPCQTVAETYMEINVQYCAEGYDTPQKLKFMGFNWTKSHKKYSVSL